MPYCAAFTVDDAVLVAAVAHHSQRDRGRPSQPYLAHPMRLVAAFEMCSVCKPSRTMKARQATLNVAAIKAAVDQLAPGGPFRTKELAEHPIVVAAHPQFLEDPDFAQAIGTHLTSALGRLNIVQVSPKGVSNATWGRRSAVTERLLKGAGCQ